MSLRDDMRLNLSVLPATFGHAMQYRLLTGLGEPRSFGAWVSFTGHLSSNGFSQMESSDGHMVDLETGELRVAYTLQLKPGDQVRSEGLTWRVSAKNPSGQVVNAYSLEREVAVQFGGERQEGGI